jgi:hypothetical protein
MVPKKSLILAGAALALFGASSSAQSQSGKVFARYNKPLKSVSLDLSTGTITRGPVVSNKAATTTVDFNNNDLGGFVGVDTGNCFCEWFDSAQKGWVQGGGPGQPLAASGQVSDLMNDIVFAYCSALASVGSGGPGGSVKLGFYEGYTLFGGAPTTAVAVFTLTGLPGNSASSSFFGGFNCYFIRVFFVTLQAFADGPIGYSWKFIDVGTTGSLGGTWPFLSCTVSCSAAILQIDGQGMTDAIDEYCPPGFLRATFTFGTTSGSFTSMSMDVREVTDFTATSLDYGSAPPFSGDNKDVLTANTAIVGGSWSPVVTIPGGAHGHGAAGAISLKIKTTVFNGPTITSSVGGRRTEILTSGTLLSTVTGPHNGAVSSLAAQPIPLSFGFVCFHFAGQATVIGGGFADFSLGHEGTTGTQ